MQLEWRLWNNVKDREKDAIDAAREVMEGNEAGALELEAAEAMLEGLCTQAKGVSDFAHDELVTGHVGEFASGTSGTEATRGASSTSTATIPSVTVGRLNILKFFHGPPSRCVPRTLLSETGTRFHSDCMWTMGFRAGTICFSCHVQNP